MLARSLPSAPGSASRSTNDPACRVTRRRARGIRHGRAHGPSSGCASSRPARCSRSRSRPRARGARRGRGRPVGDEAGDPVDPGAERLVVAVGELDHRDAHVGHPAVSVGALGAAPQVLGLLAQAGEVLVVGLELGVAVAVGLAVLAPGLLLVAAEPLDGHDHGEDERRRLAEPPGDLAGPLLVGERVGPPRQVDLAEEVGREEGLAAGERDAEEGVERDRREEDDEQHQRRPPRQPGVDADEHPDEQVPGEQEVGHHQQVPGVGRQRQLEQAGPVERREAEEEERRRDHRVREHPHRPRVHHLEQHLARPPRLVGAGLERAQRERHRRAGHEQQRHDHRDGHVHDHVHAEQHPPPDARRAAGGPDEQRPAEHPADGARHRPGVAAPAQPDHAGEVEPDGQHRGAEEEPVEPPRGEPVGAGHRPGVGVAGQLEDAAGRRRRVGHRRHAAGQHRGQPGRGTHDGELDDGQPREHPPVARARREHASAMLRRCSQPSTPSATMASVFSATTAPYAVNSPSSDPSRIQACCMPVSGDGGEAPGRPRSSSARRWRRGRRRGARRMTTSAISPPVHTTTPSRCTPSALTASSWLADPAA